MEYNLEDDYLQEFEGTKLLINNDVKNKHSNDINNTNYNNNVIGDWNNWKNSLLTPISQLRDTLWSKKEDTVVEQSEPSSSSPLPSSSSNSDVNVNDFFTYRLGTVESSIKECEEQLLNADIDGSLLDAFLLTEINIWDIEKERLILLTSKVLLIVKYDFIALKRLEFKKIQIDSIDLIFIGELVYPNKSLLQNRNTNGIRVMWNKGKPINFGTKWNPFNNDVPFVTLTSHPLVHFNDYVSVNQQRLYNVEEFVQRICEIIMVNNQNRSQNENICRIEQKSIMLENYLSIGSMIHNKSALGYFKVRGKFSF